MVGPDAYVKEGRIFDIKTDEELPSYQGLCLANLAGRFAIMNTTLTSEARDWELVHWGAVLSSVEINKFLKEKQ